LEGEGLNVVAFTTATERHRGRGQEDAKEEVPAAVFAVVEVSFIAEDVCSCELNGTNW
jgi:hypothetical protein